MKGIGEIMIRKYSLTGRYHKDRGEKNQDVVLNDENEMVSVILLSDGVSLCSEGLKGAEITCKAIRDVIMKKGKYFLSFDNRRKIEFMMSHVEYELRSNAKKDDRQIEDYSATVSCAVLDKKTGNVFLSNLGNALIIGYNRNGLEVLIKPSDSTGGTFVNTNTRAVDYTNTRCVNWNDYEGILIASDGAWKSFQNNGRIDSNICRMIMKNDLKSLEDFFQDKNTPDDCSYICLNRKAEEYERR